MDKLPSLEDRTKFAIVSGLKTTLSADLERLRDLLDNLKSVDENALKRKLRSFNFVELFEDDDLISLCEIHQLYNRHRFGMLDILSKVSPERHQTYIFFKEIFGDETKGKIIATKLMGMVKENNKRSLISLYCHLLVKFDLRPLFPESRFGN